jgi:hypothetical protein
MHIRAALGRLAALRLPRPQHKVTVALRVRVLAQLREPLQDSGAFVPTAPPRHVQWRAPLPVLHLAPRPVINQHLHDLPRPHAP